MIEITVPDENDSMSSISIENTEYFLRFTYNELADFWSFGLYTEDQDPIIAMTRIVPNFPLFHYYRKKRDMPKGDFMCLTEQEDISRDDFADGAARFLYLPDDDDGYTDDDNSGGDFAE